MKGQQSGSDSAKQLGISETVLLIGIPPYEPHSIVSLSKAKSSQGRILGAVYFC